MSLPPDDSSLRTLYSRMKELDLRSAPSFEETLQPRARRSTLRLQVAVASLVIVALVIPALMLTGGDNSGEWEQLSAESLAMVQWNAPTDFLLADDDDLLTSLPAIGVVEDSEFFWNSEVFATDSVEGPKN